MAPKTAIILLAIKIAMFFLGLTNVTTGGMFRGTKLRRLQGPDNRDNRGDQQGPIDDLKSCLQKTDTDVAVNDCVQTCTDGQEDVVVWYCTTLGNRKKDLLAVDELECVAAECLRLLFQTTMWSSWRQVGDLRRHHAHHGFDV